jgi:hypothetical protein
VAFALQDSLSLYVNGKASNDAAIIQRGRLYVPVEALKNAGAEVTQASGRISIQFKPMKLLVLFTSRGGRKLRDIRIDLKP